MYMYMYMYIYILIYMYMYIVYLYIILYIHVHIHAHVHTMINMREHTCTMYYVCTVQQYLLVCANVREYTKHHVCFKFKSTKHS